MLKNLEHVTGYRESQLVLEGSQENLSLMQIQISMTSQMASVTLMIGISIAP